MPEFIFIDDDNFSDLGRSNEEIDDLLFDECFDAPSLDFNHKTNIDVENNIFNSNDENISNLNQSFKTKCQIVYDDDSFVFSQRTDTTVETDSSSDESVGNATIKTEECFEVDVDTPLFNFTGPKVVPSRHETPVSILTANTIGAIRSRRIFRVLFDSGSNCSLIKRACLPRNCQTKAMTEQKKVATLAGKLTSKEVVIMRDIRLPEFDKNRRIDQHTCMVFDNDNCKYDIILGTNFLTKVGIKLDYAEQQMKWFDTTLPLRPIGGLKSEDFDAMVDAFHIQVEDELLGEDWLDNFATAILDAKYDYVSVGQVIDTLSHLNMHQKADLLKVLQDNQQMFGGTLGVYPHKKFHIDIEENAKPVHARPYPVPRIHLLTFKKELDHLVQIGVLAPQGESEWGSPTFIAPKKDGRVRWISDLRELNKVVKRKVYPLPIITDILRKRKGFEFFTKLDISMQYYTFELDEESQDLCTIVTPFGKYKYLRLPMGLKCSPDFAQSVMENVLRGIEDVEVYIDDIGAFSGDWNSHVKLLRIVLQRLRDNGFTINPLKCEWAVKETDWLGYWLTPRGLKPWRKKIDAILKMDRPRTPKELRRFIGCVNYYRDMWPSRAHVLKPLTDKAGLKKGEKLNWTTEMQQAFDKMRLIIAADALAAYPDHNKPFHIYTDSSDFQMGACILQGGRPVAYFSRKLSSAQKNYITMEKEMLSIVATLEEFRSMLLGAEIHVYTDHKNLTFNKDIKTQRVLRWRTKIEEFSPYVHYIQGQKNVLADNLSRLHRLDEPASLTKGKKLVDPAVISDDEQESDDEAFFLDQEFSGLCDQTIWDCIECYLNFPDTETPEVNPLSYAHIREQQQQDQQLLALLAKYPEYYYYDKLDDDVEDIVCWKKNQDDNWKIALPESMIPEVITWFHQVLGHPGQTRLRHTLTQRYFHPQLRRHIDKFKCEHCQRYKLPGKGYGLLPERQVRIAPWEEVAIDLIGPWKVTVHGKACEFSALTCIDTASNLVELVRIDNKTAAHIRDKFVQTWLCRYPRPVRCIHDKGGEFIGKEFQWLLELFSIKDVCSTSKNPQSNAICERMHQTVENVLRTLIHGNPPRNMSTAKDIVDDALATAMHAMRSTVATTLGSAPGSLAFARDMFLNVPLVADWQTIARKREQHVNENLRRANQKRRQYDYAAGESVLKTVHNPTSLGVRTNGPYTIDRVHANGTLTIRLRPGVTERINIRRVIPYR